MDAERLRAVGGQLADLCHAALQIAAFDLGEGCIDRVAGCAAFQKDHFAIYVRNAFAFRSHGFDYNILDYVAFSHKERKNTNSQGFSPSP